MRTVQYRLGAILARVNLGIKDKRNGESWAWDTIDMAHNEYGV